MLILTPIQRIARVQRGRPVSPRRKDRGPIATEVGPNVCYCIVSDPSIVPCKDIFQLGEKRPGEKGAVDA